MALVSWEGGKAGPRGLWPGGALAVCGQQGDRQQVHAQGLMGQHVEGTTVVPVWGGPWWATGMLCLDSPFSPHPHPQSQICLQEEVRVPVTLLGTRAGPDPPASTFWSGGGLSTGSVPAQPTTPKCEGEEGSVFQSQRRLAYCTAHWSQDKRRRLCLCAFVRAPTPGRAPALLRGFCLYPGGLLYIPDE